MRNLSFFFLVFLLSCGGENSIPPEKYMANAENYAKWAEGKVDGVLAWRSNSNFSKGDNKMAAWVGYIAGKPTIVRLFSKGEDEAKWWIFADSATGKALFFKEEVIKGDKKVRNRFAYLDDSVVLAMASNEPYVAQDANNDFRLKPVEVNALFKEVVTAVEADIPILSAEANAARRENAQFYATGGAYSWSLVINPSTSSVVLRQPGSEERKFGYDVPVTGPKNESIYTFNSLKGKIEVSIFSKACGVADGKSYPYTVVVNDGTKSFAGCGVLLQ